MKNLNKFWTALRRASISFVFAFLCLAIMVGFADSSYLMAQEISGKGYRCDVRGFDCGLVLHSSYAKFLGISWAFWGVAYYASMLLLLIAYVASRRAALWRIIGLFVCAGAFVSLGLIFIQAFVLHAWCLYCVVSEIAVAAMVFSYALAHLLWFRKIATTQ